MRVLLFLSLFIISCTSNNIYESNTETLGKVDSIINQSNEGIADAEIISTKSDSATKVYVIKKVQELKYLNTLKKIQQVSVIEKIITKTDTVYIETKKNFWGKSKVSKMVSKDENFKEAYDTLTTSIDIIN